MEQDLSKSVCIQGQKVFLRPYQSDDAEQMVQWLHGNDPYYITSRPFHFRSVDEQKAAFSLGENDARFIITDRQSVPVGTIEYFNLNQRNRSVQIDFMLDPAEKGKGYASEAVNMLLIILFENMGMNKIYVQAGAYNKSAIELLENTGFKLDGTLREHYYLRGQFYDGVVYSILRSDYDQLTVEEDEFEDESPGSGLPRIG
jgi:diamine N-acetyltransferase